jgi:hypothetical protein
VPGGIASIVVRVWGGGGGGGSQYPGNSYVYGSDGGTSSFGSALSATGGKANSPAGAGGVGIGGDVNETGGTGIVSNNTLGVKTGGDAGGLSQGGGEGGTQSTYNNSNIYFPTPEYGIGYTPGGGGGQSYISFVPGGGGGGFAEKTITVSESETFAITIGAGGMRAIGNSTAWDGPNGYRNAGDGAVGQVDVSW